jgi:hypothetical protein
VRDPSDAFLGSFGARRTRTAALIALLPSASADGGVSFQVI